MLIIAYGAVGVAGLLFASLVIGLLYPKVLPPRTCCQWGAIATVVFSIIAFCTYPNDGTDLSRYYMLLEEFHRYSFSELMTEWLYATTPLTTLLFAIVEKINIYNFLPALATFLIFSIHTYIVSRQVKEYKMSTLSVSLYLLSWLGIAGVRAILTGVRQHLAVAVVALAADRLLVQKKKDLWSVAMLIMSIFIHVGTLPFVGLLALFMLKDVKTYYITITIIVMFAAINVDTGIPLLEYARQKFLGYQDIEYPDMRFFLVRILFLIVLILIWWRKNQQLNQMSLTAYSKCFFSVILFTVISFNNQMLFDRMFTGLVTISLPVFHCFADRVLKKEKITVLALSLVLLFLLAGIFAYQLVDLKTSWRLWGTILGREY